MTKPGFFRRKSTYLVGIPVLILLVAVVAPYVYIHFIEGDPPKKLTFETSDSTSSTKASTGTTTATSVDGTWTITSASQVGYRVPETLFGQSTTAVGRTNAVTGTMTIDGTSVPAAEFTVDTTKITSDQANRDRQFHGRIMETATYPTATFKLTKPIDLGTIPADLKEITVPVTGDLTLHGKTNSVTFDLKARRNGDKIEVNGTIPITFADYNVSNPSVGPASVGDNGELEFLLVFAKS